MCRRDPDVEFATLIFLNQRFSGTENKRYISVIITMGKVCIALFFIRRQLDFTTEKSFIGLQFVWRFSGHAGIVHI